jgi:hypothetical protein
MPYDDLDPREARMPNVNWDIRRHGRAWHGEEARQRWELTPEKFEMDRGKLFWEDSQRLTLLALLLENVGVDQAVRLGDPEVWRAAVQDLG